MKHFIVVWFSLLVSACFQVEAPAEIANTQSSIEAKSVVEPQQTSLLSNDTIEKAYKNKRSQVWVKGNGVVKKLLADDNEGSRHQKFLVTINAHQTLLFAHNIDLAPRIDSLQVGDNVEFKGEYIYNPKGGVMHWTHHDPRGDIQGGWLKHNGKTYE